MAQTFQEFQQSRIEYADLREVCPQEHGDEPEPVRGYLYPAVDGGFPKWLVVENNGKFCAGDMVGTFTNLEVAEKHLFDFQG